MWQRYFRVVKLIPGRVHIKGFGILDFSRDKISTEVCLKLLESGFPYLEITEEGRNFFYGKPVEQNPPHKNRSKKRTQLE